MKRYFYPIVAGLLLTASAAQAEMIQGAITFVDSTNNMISIRPVDPESAQLIIKIKADTKTRGNINSVGELQAGQEVKVDAHQNKAENILEANSIEVTSAGPAQPALDQNTDQKAAY